MVMVAVNSSSLHAYSQPISHELGELSQWLIIGYGHGDSTINTDICIIIISSSSSTARIHDVCVVG